MCLRSQSRANQKFPKIRFFLELLLINTITEVDKNKVKSLFPGSDIKQLMQA